VKVDQFDLRRKPDRFLFADDTPAIGWSPSLLACYNRL
jgi:hypothetical protein